MARYTYTCENGHSETLAFPMGKAPQYASTCAYEQEGEYDNPCPGTLTRNHAADFRTIQIENDPYRMAYLSSKGNDLLNVRGKDLDPTTPKSRADAERLFKEKGRIYIGDDSSRLDKWSQAALKDHGGVALNEQTARALNDAQGA